MAAEWHYKKGDRSFGPVDATQLKALAESGAITVDDAVRREGHSQWVKARQIKGLFTRPLTGVGVKPDSAPASVPTNDAEDDDFYEATVRSSQSLSDENVDEWPVSRNATQSLADPVSLNEVLSVLIQSRSLLSEMNERDKGRKPLADILISEWIVIILKFAVANAAIGLVIGVIAGIVLLLVN